MNFPSLSKLRQAARSPRALLLPLVVLLGLSYSCCGPNKLVKAPDAAFVGMSRAIHGTIGTEYLTYISHDEALSSAQKVSRADAVGDWEFAIRQAEALLAASAPAAAVPPPAPVLEEGGGGDE